MFWLIKTLGVEMALRREALPFIAAFLIASFFFKFGSFALECVAFLAVWIPQMLARQRAAFHLNVLSTVFHTRLERNHIRPRREPWLLAKREV